MNFNYSEVDLLKISKEALVHKKEDSTVINATIGVFLNDYNNLYAFSSVDKTINKIDKTLLKSYLEIDGGKEYINNIYKYMFKDNKALFNSHHIKASWTSGGSGAIYMAMAHYQGKNVLLPNLRWGEYDNVCRVLNKNILNYNLFAGNEFDLNNIKSIFKNYNEKELLIIINDPAHNPSGYSMTTSEYEKLIELVNKYENINIKILLDLAYLDFSNNNYREEVLPLFKNLKRHGEIYLAFSGSKSFGVYGLRMGALIYLTKEEEKSNNFIKFIYSRSGAVYGLPNSLSILLFNEIIKNEDIYNEQQEAKKVLENRSKLLLDELNKNNIDYFPYESGFFLTIKEQNPLKMTTKLKNKKVYVVPANQGLRIAISAITEQEIKRLVRIIKECK